MKGCDGACVFSAGAAHGAGGSSKSPFFVMTSLWNFPSRGQAWGYGRTESCTGRWQKCEAGRKPTPGPDTQLEMRVEASKG